MDFDPPVVFVVETVSRSRLNRALQYARARYKETMHDRVARRCTIRLMRGMEYLERIRSSGMSRPARLSGCIDDLASV